MLCMLCMLIILLLLLLLLLLLSLLSSFIFFLNCFLSWRVKDSGGGKVFTEILASDERGGFNKENKTKRKREKE